MSILVHFYNTYMGTEERAQIFTFATTIKQHSHDGDDIKGIVKPIKQAINKLKELYVKSEEENLVY